MQACGTWYVNGLLSSSVLQNFFFAWLFTMPVACTLTTEP